MKKKAVLVTIVLCLVVCCMSAQTQVTTKFGDIVSSLDGIMKAYYDVVTVPKGGKVSYERDSLLHISNAGVGMVHIEADGKPKLRYITLKQYHAYADAGLEKDGFYEIEIGRKVEKFGQIYHVWSTYESRNTDTGPVIERGINSIEMYFDGKRFWITSWIYDSERKGNEIPKEYLGK